MALLLSALLFCAFFNGCKQAPTEAVDPHTIPLHADQIKEGTYAIEVTSSSSMFNIIDAQLTVKDGNMSAVLTLSGTGYLKLYMGTGEQALLDTDDKCIYYVVNPDSMYTYDVPAEALNVNINCAAWSIKNERWYDRVLVFKSSLIPDSALIVE